MEILPLHQELVTYLKRRKLEKKFAKQALLFQNDPFHPGLNFELLEPKHLRLYSFRVDRKYRTILIFLQPNKAEIIDINNHYN